MLNPPNSNINTKHNQSATGASNKGAKSTTDYSNLDISKESSGMDKITFNLQQTEQALKEYRSCLNNQQQQQQSLQHLNLNKINANNSGINSGSSRVTLKTADTSSTNSIINMKQVKQVQQIQSTLKNIKLSIKTNNENDSKNGNGSCCSTDMMMGYQ